MITFLPTVHNEKTLAGQAESSPIEKLFRIMANDPE